jgi:hypothetical protein
MAVSGRGPRPQPEPAATLTIRSSQRSALVRRRQSIGRTKKRVLNTFNQPLRDRRVDLRNEMLGAQVRRGWYDRLSNQK